MEAPEAYRWWSFILNVVSPHFSVNSPNNIKKDKDLDDIRTEVLCKKYSAHLDHVFFGEEFTELNTRIFSVSQRDPKTHVIVFIYIINRHIDTKAVQIQHEQVHNLFCKVIVPLSGRIFPLFYK